ncbi:MAG: carbohydrate-binding domain-containing protein [Clostridia bacterium]|nr:carbohydrate-binding domain-containing protein [Clostridia bacterium]
MKKLIYAAIVVLLVGLLFSGCANSTNGGSSSESATTYVSPSSLETVSVVADEPPREGAANIRLNGSSADTEGSGAAFADGVLTISAGGVYVLSGELDNGKILVNAPKESVKLIFDGVSVSCSNGSPLYVYKASEVLVYLTEGTENFLSDGASYSFAGEYASAADDEPNACLYSKADLVIAGKGSLSVTANYKNGITSKDTLTITGCTLSVTAKNHGVNGKDKNTVYEANITVKASEGDGIRSSNDTDEGLGVISISDSVISIECANDGVQAVTSLAVSNSKISIVSGGGSRQGSSSDSAKGLKSDGALMIDGGVYDLDCRDDAVHANGDVLIKDGVFTISTADDAFHADKSLVFEGGEIAVAACKEGYEGMTVTVSGGTHSIVSTDDGMNASSGKTSSTGFNRNEFQDDENCRITIEGGSVTIKAGGDGVDSNGSIYMTGGSLVVSSSGNADGALDFNGAMSFTGGYLLAVTGGSMPEAPGTASQPVISIGLGSNLAAGTSVTIKTNSAEIALELPVNANHVVFSSPELVSGETAVVTAAGTELGTATLTAGTVTVGTVIDFGPGGQGQPGGQGGFPGGQGRPGGQGGFPGGQGGFPGGGDQGDPPGFPGPDETSEPSDTSGIV